MSIVNLTVLYILCRHLLVYSQLYKDISRHILSDGVTFLKYSTNESQRITENYLYIKELMTVYDIVYMLKSSITKGLLTS